jgi:hypothetical protein
VGTAYQNTATSPKGHIRVEAYISLSRNPIKNGDRTLKAENGDPIQCTSITTLQSIAIEYGVAWRGTIRQARKETREQVAFQKKRSFLAIISCQMPFSD